MSTQSTWRRASLLPAKPGIAAELYDIFIQLVTLERGRSTISNCLAQLVHLITAR